MDFIKKNIKWITIGMCVLAVVGLFLPIMTMSMEFLGQTIKESIVFIERDGAIVFAAIVVALVFLLLNKEVIALAPLFVGFGITAYDSFNAASMFGEVTAISSDIKIGFGIGFYFTIIGLVLAIVTILYNLFGIKKMTVAEVFLSIKGYKTPAQPQGQVVYAQSYGNYNNSSNGYNGINASGGYNTFNQQPASQPNYNVGFNEQTMNNNFGYNNMPTSQVNADIFNQPPIMQQNVPTQNQVQTVGVEQPNMYNQPITQPNYMEQNMEMQNAMSKSPTTVCPQCRATLNVGAQFCNQCGSKTN